MISEKRLDEISAADTTLGAWQTEVDSVLSLDAIFDGVPTLWNVYREVPGELIQPAYAQQDKTVRIDRIVTPKRELIELGWTHGAVGFECKKSDVKIGPPIAQATDYARSLFRLDNGVKIWLDMVFVWAMAPQHGPLASVLYQQRVGSAYSYRWAKLKLKLGEVSVLDIDPEGNVTIGNSPNGRKAGSR